MDSVNNFLNEYIFTQGVESRVGQYGNDIVDLINKFIRIIIAFMIVYLIIIKLPDHGDKDHTMYFNLILLISIFLILIYIQKSWRGYYLMDFLDSGGYDPRCARDQDDPPDRIGDSKCPTTLEENGSLLINSMVKGFIKQLNPMENWQNYLYLIGLGLLLRQLDYKSYYALLIFIPFNSIKGIIYYLLYASKYSPINFLFGKTGNIEDPYIYEDNKISEGKQLDSERELKNFNEKFYVMYIVLILLIFFTIIIRLTSDTIIDCAKFIGPIPINALQGCIGYRFYMVLNVILFIGFSTDFMDSLQKISLEEDIYDCPWKIDQNGVQLPSVNQIYTSRKGECLNPNDIIDTPQNCKVDQEILECKSDITTDLPGCFIKRSDYNNDRYILKDVVEFNEKRNPGLPAGVYYPTRSTGVSSRASDRPAHPGKIIIAKNPEGGYKIHSSNEIKINDSKCLNSINRWLASQNDDSIFEPLPESIINGMNNITDDVRSYLLTSIGVDSNNNN